MILTDRKTKLAADLDHARAQANQWTQNVIALSAQLVLLDELVNEQANNDTKS